MKRLASLFLLASLLVLTSGVDHAAPSLSDFVGWAYSPTRSAIAARMRWAGTPTLPGKSRQNPPAYASVANAPADARISFVPVHIYIDPHGKPLACYQVHIVASAGDVKLVGIEGGESSAFNNAPYYDPRALQGNRIVLGAYSLGADVPAGKTRVATLMFRVAGAVEPQYDATLDVAGTTDGSPITASISVVPGIPPAPAKNETIPSNGETR